MIHEAKNAEALPTTGAFTETNQVPFSKGIIPQSTQINKAQDNLKLEFRRLKAYQLYDEKQV